VNIVPAKRGRLREGEGKDPLVTCHGEGGGWEGPVSLIGRGRQPNVPHPEGLNPIDQKKKKKRLGGGGKEIRVWGLPSRGPEGGGGTTGACLQDLADDPSGPFAGTV